MDMSIPLTPCLAPWAVPTWHTQPHGTLPHRSVQLQAACDKAFEVLGLTEEWGKKAKELEREEEGFQAPSRAGEGASPHRGRGITSGEGASPHRGRGITSRRLLNQLYNLSPHSSFPS